MVFDADHVSTAHSIARRIRKVTDSVASELRISCTPVLEGAVSLGVGGLLIDQTSRGWRGYAPEGTSFKRLLLFRTQPVAEIQSGLCRRSNQDLQPFRRSQGTVDFVGIAVDAGEFVRRDRASSAIPGIGHSKKAHVLDILSEPWYNTNGLTSRQAVRSRSFLVWETAMQATLRPVERQRVYDSIVDQIRRLIADGTWKPGQRLPSERELTDMLSVGRTSVREALRILEGMGFVEIRPGDGSYVRESVAVPSRLHELIDLTQGDEYIADLMETRELIESQIAFMAAESATLEDIADLETIVDRQAAFIEKGDARVEDNIEFHLRLTQATGNRVLVELQQIFFQLSRDTIIQLFHVPGRPQESLRQHRAIIQAIRERRPIDAHRLMLEHLRSRYTFPNRDDRLST